MIEITKENLEDLKFDGIIVSVPFNTVKGQHDDISFIFECAYYTHGKHGYPEKSTNADYSSFYSAWYNGETLLNGLSFNSTSRFTLEHIFSHWDNYKYYKFHDMTEFCTWYLQQKGREIWIDDGENKGLVHKIEPRKETTAEINTYKKVNKEWIHEKCGTNTPPTSVPEKPSVGNIKQGTNKGGVNQYNGESRPEKPGFQYNETYRNCDDIYEQVNALNIPEKDKIALYKYLRTTRSYINTQVESFNEFLKDYFKEEAQKFKNRDKDFEKYIMNREDLTYREKLALIQNYETIEKCFVEIYENKVDAQDISDTIKLFSDITYKVKELDKAIEGLNFIDEEHGFNREQIQLAKETIEKLNEQKKDAYWDLYKKTDNEEVINLIDSQYPEFKEKMKTVKDKIQEVLNHCKNDDSMLNYMYRIVTGNV